MGRTWKYGLRLTMLLLAIILTASTAYANQHDLTAPEDPQRTTVESSSAITWRWTDTNTKEQGYKIYSVSGESRTLVATLGSDATSFAQAGLGTGASHTIAVRAFRGGQESPELLLSAVTRGFLPWWVNYTGNALPQNQGWDLWGFYGNAGSSIDFDNVLDLYAIGTESGSSAIYYERAEYLSGSYGTTLETRLKTSGDVTGNELDFTITDQYTTVSMLVFNTQIAFTASGGGEWQWVNVDTTRYHTYRIVMRDLAADLYIDGALAATISNPPTREIPFITGSVKYMLNAQLGKTAYADIDYLSYTRSGAFGY